MFHFMKTSRWTHLIPSGDPYKHSLSPSVRQIIKKILWIYKVLTQSIKGNKNGLSLSPSVGLHVLPDLNVYNICIYIPSLHIPHVFIILWTDHMTFRRQPVGQKNPFILHMFKEKHTVQTMCQPSSNRSDDSVHLQMVSHFDHFVSNTSTAALSSL